MQGAGSLSELLEPDQFYEKFIFLIVESRESHIKGQLKLLIWTTNVIYKSYLVAPTYVKIQAHMWQYYIGVGICLFYLSSCHGICLDGAHCQKTPQLRDRIPLPLGRRHQTRLQIVTAVLACRLNNLKLIPRPRRNGQCPDELLKGIDVQKSSFMFCESALLWFTPLPSSYFRFWNLSKKSMQYRKYYFALNRVATEQITQWNSRMCR